MGERTASLVVDAKCSLGEGPYWDHPRDRFAWLDVTEHQLHLLDFGSQEWSLIPLPTRISCIAVAMDGGLVLAGDGGVHRSDGDATSLQRLADLPMASDTRTNDGAVDPHGRLWIGTSSNNASDARGALFRVDADGRVTTLREGVSMSNGIGFSPDGTRAYHVDTRRHRLDELLLDDAGDPTEIRPLIEVETMPDGLAVDVDGGIWLAHWDGGAVHRYASDGNLDEVLRVDGGWITSCAFGPGTSLYVTSARADLPPGSAVPNAGGLFVADAGVAGLPLGVFGS